MTPLPLRVVCQCLSSYALFGYGLRLQTPIVQRFAPASDDNNIKFQYMSMPVNGYVFHTMESTRLRVPNGTLVVHTMEEELNCPHLNGAYTCPRAQSLSIPYIAQKLEHEGTHRSLNGERLVIIGDSLGYELWNTLQCAIGGEVDATIEWAGMAAVPHDSSVLKAFLSNVIKSNSLVKHTTLVFSVGSWYNWDWSQYDNTTSLAEFPPQYTRTLIRGHACNDGALLKYAKHDPGEYGFKRRECNSLGLDAFVSDLARLKDALKSIRLDNVEVVWKSIPPQHWPTQSGQFDESSEHPPCTPIRDRTMAHRRNDFAERALGLFEVNSPFSYLDTWEDDVGRHEMHTIGECTHFCNPSVVTWNWAGQLLHFMTKAPPAD